MRPSVAIGGDAGGHRAVQNGFERVVRRREGGAAYPCTACAASPSAALATEPASATRARAAAPSTALAGEAASAAQARAADTSAARSHPAGACRTPGHRRDRILHDGAACKKRQENYCRA